MLKIMHGFFNASSPPFKELPRDLVVFLAGGEGEGGGVAAPHLAGAAGEGVVGGGGDGAVGQGEGDLGVFLAALAREARSWLNPHVALNPESRVSGKVLVHPSHICQTGASDQGHFGSFSGDMGEVGGAWAPGAPGEWLDGFLEIRESAVLDHDLISSSKFLVFCRRND